MRRMPTAVVAVLCLCLSVAVLPATAASADEPGVPAVSTGGVAPQVLERAAEALVGDARATGRAGSPTLALRDLFVALPRLDAGERRRAGDLLARPTDGADDPNGDGYRVRSKRTCSARICVHWVPSTADAPPDRAWVDRTMAVMKRTWRREVGALGYRRPVTDGRRGGDSRFDVYLKDVGSQGFYGYCAPERRQEGWRWRASGFCVLDDDFARSQFGIKPLKSLKVTAAHEFFHAVQFAYDYGEDRWLMEGTATWMEERVADDIDDNRQYLKHGQVGRPAAPLDTFDRQGFNQYGNWAFFEYLSHRWDNGLVRRIWDIAADVEDRPEDPYSTAAVAKALPGRLTFPALFRSYAAANTVPARSYPEGDRWPSAPSATTHTLTPATASAQDTLEVDHMAAKNVTVVPGAGVSGRNWRLRITVDGPARATGPGAVVLVHRTGGGVAQKAVRLGEDGDGRRVVRFGSNAVSKATITLANGSTRFRCWRRDYTYSCQGDPRDDDRRFGYRLRLTKG